MGNYTKYYEDYFSAQGVKPTPAPKTSLSFKDSKVENDFNLVSPEMRAVIEKAPPGVITSAFRDEDENTRVGGVPNSYHTKGQAVDYRKTPNLKEITDYYKANGFQPIEESDHLHIEPLNGKFAEASNSGRSKYSSYYEEYFRNAKPIPKAQEEIQAPAPEEPGILDEAQGALQTVGRGLKKTVAGVTESAFPYLRNIGPIGPMRAAEGLTRKLGIEPPSTSPVAAYDKLMDYLQGVNQEAAQAPLTPFEQRHGFDISAPLVDQPPEKTRAQIQALASSLGMNPEGTIPKVASGVLEPVNELASQLTSPVNLALLAASKNPMIGRTTAAAFAPGMIEGAGAGAEQALEGIKERDLRKSIAGGVGAAMLGSAAPGMLKYAVTPTPFNPKSLKKAAKVEEEVIPDGVPEGLLKKPIAPQEEIPIEQAPLKETPIENLLKKEVSPPVEATPKDFKLYNNSELLKTIFGDEAGSIGKLSESTIASREAANELLRRLKDEAGRVGEKIEDTALRIGLTAKQFNTLLQKQDSKDSPSSFIGETGLKSGKLIENKLSYNPEKINAPEDVEALFKNISKEQNEFKPQRLSKSDASIQDLSKLVGVKVEDLIKSKPGSIANSETVYRARQEIMNLAQDLKNTINKTDSATASPEQLSEVKTKYLRLMGVMKAVAGYRTEAAHVFRQFKIKVAPNESELMSGLLNDLKRAGFQNNDLGTFAEKARKLADPTLGDKLWHLWYSSILSGPTTHLKNLAGNTTQLALELARVTATHPKELPAAIGGLYQGLIKGASRGKDILKHGEANKFEARGLLPIEFKGKSKFLNAADYVGRLLAASDAVFNEGSKGMEAGGLARAQGVKEGLKGLALKSRTKDLFKEKYNSPEADAFAARNTYTQKPAGVIGAVADSMGKTTRDVPMAKFVIPFTRIVANVVNNSLDWTPLGFARALKPGLLTDGKKPFEIGTPRQKYQALGRAALGTIAMGYFSNLAAQDKLTGNGPSDYKKRQQLEATGWKRNSMKIGDTYYPYSNWGPMAVPMALVGNFFDSRKYGGMSDKDSIDQASSAVLGAAKTILDMSFLSGVSDLISAVHDSDTRGGSFAKNFVAQQVSSAVPNLAKQIGRYANPYQYETDTIGDKIKSNLRVTSGLRKSIDVWGDPIKGERLTQLEPSSVKHDAVKDYLIKNKLWVSLPSKSTQVFDESLKAMRPMTKDEYYNYIKISGPRIKEAIEKNLKVIDEQADPDAQQDIIDRIVQQQRKRTKYEIQRGEYEK